MLCCVFSLFGEREARPSSSSERMSIRFREVSMSICGAVGVGWGCSPCGRCGEGDFVGGVGEGKGVLGWREVK